MPLVGAVRDASMESVFQQRKGRNREMAGARERVRVRVRESEG